jgi:hypothetical protein
MGKNFELGILDGLTNFVDGAIEEDNVCMLSQ